jgi:hypothetical protein
MPCSLASGSLTQSRRPHWLFDYSIMFATRAMGIVAKKGIPGTIEVHTQRSISLLCRPRIYQAGRIVAREGGAIELMVPMIYHNCGDWQKTRAARQKPPY